MPEPPKDTGKIVESFWGMNCQQHLEFSPSNSNVALAAKYHSSRICTVRPEYVPFGKKNDHFVLPKVPLGQWRSICFLGVADLEKF
jgi:hypothetical protein